MLLHTDIPTPDQLNGLLSSRNPASVTVYLGTNRRTDNQAARIELGSLITEAARQLRAAGHENRRIAKLEDEFADLLEDEDFWCFQSRSLALFATPGSLQSFRLPNRLTSSVAVADRFHLTPLLRTATFPQVAWVLALAQGSVRVVEISADDEPREVKLPDLPSDAASAAGKASLADPSPVRRIQGQEGRKLRLRQYSRKIDHALRPLVNGSRVPLILACTDPLDGIFREVNSYPHLAAQRIVGNPEELSDGELALHAREVLDGLYAEEVRKVHESFEARQAEGRALEDLAEVARAATIGAVQAVLVDIDDAIPGTIDETTGAVTLGANARAEHYGVADEIARRVLLHGGRVLAVRRAELPGQQGVAAILRYPL